MKENKINMPCKMNLVTQMQIQQIVLFLNPLNFMHLKRTDVLKK